MEFVPKASPEKTVPILPAAVYLFFALNVLYLQVLVIRLSFDDKWEEFNGNNEA